MLRSRMASTSPRTARERVAAHRARLRAQGLKPIQIWVPDPKSPHFAEAARRQSRAAAESPTAEDDQAFIDSISIWPDDCDGD